MGQLARSRSMMDPQRATVMIVLICLGAGVVADGHISRLSGLSSPVKESKIESENKNVNLSEHRRSSATGLRQEASLSDYLWSSATDLLQQTRNTTFIAGVAAGDLNPNFYGQYILQDAALCREVAKLWRDLVNDRRVPEELRTYAIRSYEDYQRCSTSLFAPWHIKDDGLHDYGVNMQPVLRNYLNTIRNSMVEYPPNVMIATFAYVKLRSSLTEELWSHLMSTQTKNANPYSIWVEKNRGSSSATRHAAKIDEWDQNKDWFKWNEALTIFRQAMIGEFTMFNLKAKEPKPLTSTIGIVEV